MALIPLEGFGAPFQKTCPNSYILKTIHTSSQCGTICSTQIPTIPLEQRVSLQAQLSSHWKIKCSIETQLFTSWEPHALCEVPTAVGHSSTPRNRRAPITRSTTVKFLQSPRLASQGPYCAIAPLGDLHRRTSPTHTTKFGVWL